MNELKQKVKRKLSKVQHSWFIMVYHKALLRFAQTTKTFDLKLNNVKMVLRKLCLRDPKIK